MVARPPSRYPWRSSASETPLPDCSRSSCTLGEYRIAVCPERSGSKPLGPTRAALASVGTCSVGRFATSTWPAWPAGTADRRHCWRNTTAARLAGPLFARLAVRPFVAGAAVGSADADACSERAAARNADFGDGSGSGEAIAADSGSFDSSATSRCSPDAAARIGRGPFAPVQHLAPEPFK